MAKKSRDNKSPSIGLELKGRIPEAISRVFEALTGLSCDVLQYLRLRIHRANKRLRESTRAKEDHNSRSPN